MHLVGLSFQAFNGERKKKHQLHRRGSDKSKIFMFEIGLMAGCFSKTGLYLVIFISPTFFFKLPSDT